MIRRKKAVVIYLISMIMLNFSITGGCSDDSWQDSYSTLQEGEIYFDQRYGTGEAEIILNIPKNATSVILYEDNRFIGRWQGKVGLVKRKLKRTSGAYVYRGEIFYGNNKSEHTKSQLIYFQ